MVSYAMPTEGFTAFDAPGARGAVFGNTVPVSINDRGVIAGYFIVGEESARHGFIRWPDGKFTDFDVASQLGSETEATSINSAGTIAGVFQGKDGYDQGFVRTADGKFSYFKSPDSTGISNYAEPLPDYPRINREGTVAGSDSIGRGFVRTANGDFEEFNAPGATATYVEGINAAGEITGFLLDASLHSADFIRCHDGHFVILTPPGIGALEGSTMSTGINDKGQVVGWYTVNGKVLGFLRNWRNHP
jgi:hypothetical protein